MTTLPNLLTLSRIVAIPLIAALFWIEGPEARWAALVLFTAACITDFLDGYLARTRGEISRLGRFLDPVADKLLIASILLLLTAFERIHGFDILAALVILCREILVSGLREFLASLKVGLPVSRLAKWKTTIQMFAIGFLLVGDAAPGWVPAIMVGEIGLWAAAALTLITGYDYLRAGLRHLIDETPGERRTSDRRIGAESSSGAE
jgi:cardiolipin synthase